MLHRVPHHHWLPPLLYMSRSLDQLGEIQSSQHQVCTSRCSWSGLRVRPINKQVVTPRRTMMGVQGVREHPEGSPHPEGQSWRMTKGEPAWEGGKSWTAREHRRLTCWSVRTKQSLDTRYTSRIVKACYHPKCVTGILVIRGGWCYFWTKWQNSTFLIFNSWICLVLNTWFSYRISYPRT